MNDPAGAGMREKRELSTVLFDSARWNDFSFRDDDIVVVTWGKSGTTWTQQIVGQLVLGAPEGISATKESPWLDCRLFPHEEIIAQLEAQNHRRFIKTHLPLDALAFSDQAKYIYVGRDVRDIVWSAYNHQAGFTQGALDAFNNLPGWSGSPLTHPPCDVREYYVSFLRTGEMLGFPLAPLWEHVQGWWNVRKLSNVLLVHFNNLKSDMGGEIRRIAEFLGVEIDEAVWPEILEHCSFEYMKRESAKEEVLDDLFQGGGKTFFHKGANGRWKDVLTEEEIAECDQVAAQHLAPDCAHWLRTGEVPRE